MECRAGCGACCIAPSISTPLPGMPGGKPAGVRCPHLSDSLQCKLWGDARRPDVCAQFRPERDICGTSAAQAMATLVLLEQSA